MGRIQSEPVFLGIGANLGDRQAALHKSASILRDVSESEIRMSSIFQSHPAGPENQPDFLNMCVSFQSAKSPEELLEFCIKLAAIFIGH